MTHGAVSKSNARTLAHPALRAVSFLFALGSVAGAIEAAAEPPDWSKIVGHDVVLFQPGQSSFEWLLTESDHSGAPKVRKAKHCRSCHEGEEEDVASDQGDELGLAPTLTANVKLARDSDRLYVRLEWQGLPEAPTKKLDPDHEVRATLLFDGGSVKSFGVAGCWLTCHADLPGMPSAAEKSELTKYLGASRVKITRSGGGENLMQRGDLDGMLAASGFLEYWQVTANRGQPALAHDGYVLESRHQNETPLVSAQASFADGRWVVVLSRELEAGSKLHKDIVAGTTYTIGIAIHEGWSQQRFHYVSFGRTFVLDQGKADWVVGR
jgi:cytochrome c-type protein NapC